VRLHNNGFHTDYVFPKIEFNLIDERQR